MIIPPEVFGVSKFCAPENTKYAINAVYVRRLANGECVTAATDGRVMIEFRWQDSDKKAKAGFSRLIPAGDWKVATRIAGKDGEMSLLEQTADKVFCLHGQINSTSTWEIKGDVTANEFPDYDNEKYSIFPRYTGKDSVCVGMQTKLLAPTLQILTTLPVNKEDKAVVITVPFKEGRPMLFSKAMQNGVRVKAMVMPVTITAEADCKEIAE